MAELSNAGSSKAELSKAGSQADLSDAEIAALLRVCEAERIEVPAAIQPHGMLLAIDRESHIVFVSGNTQELLGADPKQLLGEPVSSIAGLPNALELKDIRRIAARPGARVPTSVTLAWRKTEMLAFLSGDCLVLEFESGGSSGHQDWYELLPDGLAALQAADSVEALTGSLAVLIRNLTGFDRVMIYRFDPEWNGTVIAEEKDDSLAPYFGLRYPASDIPAQARALYTRNWQRLIPDVGYVPVPVEAIAGRDASQLDLSDSALRSVSPLHLRYLANMGVRASMSISLLVDGRLWGLVACHHYAGEWQPSLRTRTATEFLGRTAALLLQSVQRLNDSQAELRVAHTAAKVTEEFQTAGVPELSDGLLGGETTIRDLFDCSAAAVFMDGRLRTIGDPPSNNELYALARLLWPRERRSTMAVESVSALSRLAGAEDLSPGLAATAAGVLGVPIPGTRDSWLLWTRAEVLREQTWAGDPTAGKEVVAGPAGLALSPRTSFARYTELVRGTAPSWQPHEVDVAENIARLVGEARAHRSEQDSRLTAALQRAVLLDAVPNVAGFNVAVRYLPFAEDAVGGDFYDFVALPNGHLAVVAGDVAGHGLAVAGVTAELRHALRAYLIRERSAPRALARLNELAAWLLPSELATVVVVDIDLAAKSAMVASAGHLPPLLIRDGEARYLAAESAPALGADARSAYTERSYALEAGDRLLLFSDGLIEKRGESLDVSLDRLRSAAVAIAAGIPLEAACDRLLEELRADSSGDDVMLVALEPTALS
jgi:chemotaxis family two-component system sensor kinase Cph1